MVHWWMDAVTSLLCMAHGNLQEVSLVNIHTSRHRIGGGNRAEKCYSGSILFSRMPEVPSCKERDHWWFDGGGYYMAIRASSVPGTLFAELVSCLEAVVDWGGCGTGVVGTSRGIAVVQLGG